VLKCALHSRYKPRFSTSGTRTRATDALQELRHSAPGGPVEAILGQPVRVRKVVLGEATCRRRKRYLTHGQCGWTDPVVERAIRTRLLRNRIFARSAPAEPRYFPGNDRPHTGSRGRIAHEHDCFPWLNIRYPSSRRRRSAPSGRARPASALAHADR